MDEQTTSEALDSRSAQMQRSAKAVEQSTGELADSADRRTQLASDRTLLAAERTYAAWVRTALAALAGGIGARALVRDILPPWVGQASGTILIVFAGFCLIAGIWRELHGVPRDPGPDMKPVPRSLLVVLNLLMLLVALAALVGIWAS
jgi:putative membrane protein